MQFEKIFNKNYYLIYYLCSGAIPKGGTGVLPKGTLPNDIGGPDDLGNGIGAIPPPAAIGLGGIAPIGGMPPCVWKPIGNCIPQRPIGGIAPPATIECMPPMAFIGGSAPGENMGKMACGRNCE